MTTTIDVFNPLLEEGIQKLSTTAETFAALTKEPTGFEDPAGLTVTYSTTNRTIILSHASGFVRFWTRGVAHEYASPWTVPTVLGGATPITHTNANGSYYLKIHADTLAVTYDSNPWNFSDYVTIAFTYKDATAHFSLREVHGLMQWQIHEEEHYTTGTYIRTAVTPTAGSYAVLTGPTATNAANTPGTDIHTIYDEDLPTSIAAWPEGTYTIAHRLGANGPWVWSTTDTSMFKVGASTFIQFNLNTAGTWSLADVPENSYVNMLNLSLPVTADAESQKFRIVRFVGQRTHTTLAAAQAETPSQYDFGSLVGGVTEFVPNLMWTLQKDSTGGGATPAGVTGRCFIAAEPVRFVGSQRNLVGVSGLSPTDHQSLSNRSAVDAHPASAITVTPVGALAATDAQSALQELDSDLTGHIGATGSFHGTTGLATAEPGAVSSSTSGQVGTSTKLAREDHRHDLGIHTHETDADGGPVNSNRIYIVQANSFTVGQALYLSGTTYALAKADTAATAEVVGIVESSDGSTFTMITAGYITGLTAGTAGTNYFLSDATAGLLTATEPTTIGNISKPVLYADTTTSGFVNIMRGVVVGGVNARASVSIPDGAGVTTIQDVSAYDGGVIDGTVKLDATTDLNGTYRIDFCKNGAGTYTASVSYTGDAVVTFSMTTAGLLQATLGGAKAGYASCVFNYALNAPAVGATFPLSVSARTVLGDTSGTAVPAGYIGEVRLFNSVTVASVTSGIKAGTILDTLPAGRWRLDWIAVFGSAASSTGANVAISTNNADDNTNTLPFAGFTSFQTMYDLNFTAEIVGKPYIIDVATTQAIYPKVLAFGANRNVTVRGQATRIA